MDRDQTTYSIKSNVCDPHAEDKPGSSNIASEFEPGTSNTHTNDKTKVGLTSCISNSGNSSITKAPDRSHKSEEKTIKMLTECTATMETDRVPVGPKGIQYKKTQNIKVTSSQATNKGNENRSVTLVKSSGYRNKNCFVPVNKHTAIHLPRPTNPVTENTHTPKNSLRPVIFVSDMKSTQMQHEHFSAERSVHVSSNEPGLKPHVVYPSEQYDGKTGIPKSSCHIPNTINSHSTNCQTVDYIVKSDMQTNMSKWTSILKNPENVIASRVKKAKLSPVVDNLFRTAFLKCQNNNSKVKNKSSPVSSSCADITSTSYSSSAAGMDHSDVLQNKISNKRQPNSDFEIDENVSNTEVRNNEAKTSAMSTPSRDMSSYISLPSTSKCGDQCSAYQLKTHDTINVHEPSNQTDIINYVASGELDVPCSTATKKTKTKTVIGKLESNTETFKKAKTMGLLKNKQYLEENSSKTPCNQRSKSFYDLESRYQTGIYDEDDLYKSDSDVIRQVEAYKLSSVKDHRLLTLSEEEKAFLRSKSYLNDDATEDVKRPSHSIRLNNNSERTRTECLGGNEIVFPHGEEITSGKKEEPNESMSTLEKQKVRMVVPKVSSRDDKKIAVKSEYMDLSHPIIRLERVDNQIRLATASQTNDKQSQRSSITDLSNETDAKNASNTNKVYYVINKDDLNKIKVPANTLTEKTTQNMVTVNTGPAISSNKDPLIQKQANQNLVSNQTRLHQTSGQNSLERKARPQKKKQTGKTAKGKIKNRNCGINKGQHVGTPGNTSDQSFQHGPSTSSFDPSHKSITVKDLLELKRKTAESKVSFIQNMTSAMPMQVINIPFGVYDREVHGMPIHTVVMQDTHIEGKPVTVLTPIDEYQDSKGYVSAQPSTSSSSKESPSNNRLQGGQSRNLQRSERVIRIVNPSNLIPLSDIRTTTFTRSPIQSASVEPVHSTTFASYDVTSNDGHIDKPIHIKIGDKTMIVRNRPRIDMENRKTLPAPKPKHKVVDDYKKRKRRSSKNRKFVKKDQRCLQAKLKKLLMKSEDSLHKLAQSLDLVPLDILKQALTEPTAEFDYVIRNKSKAHFNENAMQVAGASDELVDAPNHFTEEYRKEIYFTPSADIANVMQIYTDVEGVCSYKKHQVQIKYRHYGLPAADHCTQSEFPCRLKFDNDGNIQKISIETLRQGLYLINKRSVDVEFTRNKRVLNTTLLIYPPHAAVLPAGSLSIAVGDIFSSAQKDRYRCEPTGQGNIQEELQQFLWPFTMDNVEELIDRRYGSVTERSLSPRCCSPRFYTKAMAHAFDRCGNVIDSDPSSEDLTAENNGSLKRLDVSGSKSDCQAIRSSEKAMALKIRQNELFESCRKLKSKQTHKIEPKKKRRRVKIRECIDIRPQQSGEAIDKMPTSSETVQERVQDDRSVDVLIETDAELCDIDVE